MESNLNTENFPTPEEVDVFSNTTQEWEIFLGGIKPITASTLDPLTVPLEIFLFAEKSQYNAPSLGRYVRVPIKYEQLGKLLELYTQELHNRSKANLFDLLMQYEQFRNEVSNLTEFTILLEKAKTLIKDVDIDCAYAEVVEAPCFSKKITISFCSVAEFLHSRDEAENLCSPRESAQKIAGHHAIIDINHGENVLEFKFGKRFSSKERAEEEIKLYKSILSLSDREMAREFLLYRGFIEYDWD